MMKKLLGIALLFVTVTTFAQTDETNTTYSSKGRPDIPGMFLIELGFNVLIDQPDALGVSTFNSKTVNMTYLRDIRIGETHFYVMPGFGVGLHKYGWDNNITLNQSFNGTTTEVTIDTLTTSLNKTFLAANYFDIPLEFRYYLNPDNRKASFNVGVGIKGGVLFSSHSKIKYELDGENIKEKFKKDFGLNRFRYGVTGRIGIGGFNLFYYQNLNELFSEDGPVGADMATSTTVGLSFTGF